MLLLLGTRFFMMFLIGLCVWRRGVFQNAAAHRSFLGTAMRSSLPVGIATTAAAGMVYQAYRPDPNRLSWLSLGIQMGIYMVQIPLSGWWLRRFRFGPAEWVWRSLTYGAVQPMRLERSVTVGV